MPRTIRGQLAASYALVALLSVLAVGVVALSLLRHHVVLQEQQLLDSSADALAGQLWPLMADGIQTPLAHRLVSSAAFLSGARVRVLGQDRAVLFDSGSTAADADFVWFMNDLDGAANVAPSAGASVGPSGGPLGGPFVVALTTIQKQTQRAADEHVSVGVGMIHEREDLDKIVRNKDFGKVPQAGDEPIAGVSGAISSALQAGERTASEVMVLRRRPAPFGDQFVYQVEPLAPAGAAKSWSKVWRAHGQGGLHPGMRDGSGVKVAISASLGTAAGVEALAATLTSSPSTFVAAASEDAPASFNLPLAERADLADHQPLVRRALGGERVAVAAIGSPAAPLGFVEFRRRLSLGGEGLAAAVRAFGWAALGAMGLAALLALVVSRSLTAPLADLATAAGKMQAGDLSARAPVGGSAEVAAVAGQFNAMAAELEANFGAIAADRDALRRFIADASHELRTPITALKTFNSLLEGAASAGQTAESSEFVTESRAQIERLEWLTQNLLDLSRLESGLVRLETGPVPVAELVAAAVAAERPLAEVRGVALVAADMPAALAVSGDRRWLEMAFGNLINNAIKFTPHGGRVEVGARDDSPGAVRLWVADEGPGVADGERERIFDRFYRGQASAGGAVPGSGLGLAIVRGVAEAHGGRAWVEPAGQAGSRFVVELPRC